MVRYTLGPLPSVQIMQVFSTALVDNSSSCTKVITIGYNSQ